MQSIINENPFETNDQNFYAQTVDKLFEIYQKLGKSSLEIENLIKFYMDSNQYTEQERPGLDQLTFSYMVQSEQNIKVMEIKIQNLIKLCDQRMEQTVGQHREKLEIILKMINFDEQEFYDEIEKQISEENFSLKQRKKKRKIKENELTTDPNEIIAKLDQLKIDNDRRECEVSKGWLASIATKLSSCV